VENIEFVAVERSSVGAKPLWYANYNQPISSVGATP